MSTTTRSVDVAPVVDQTPSMIRVAAPVALAGLVGWSATAFAAVAPSWSEVVRGEIGLLQTRIDRINANGSLPCRPTTTRCHYDVSGGHVLVGYLEGRVCAIALERRGGKEWSPPPFVLPDGVNIGDRIPVGRDSWRGYERVKRGSWRKPVDAEGLTLNVSLMTTNGVVTRMAMVERGCRTPL
jgi:hypothetical protein